LKKILPLYCLIIFVIACNNNKTTRNSNKINKKVTVVTPNDTTFGVTATMAKINGGKYVPLYGRDSQLVTISNFLMDVLPVSNANYLAFVKTNKRWRKTKVKKIFADENYLYHWKNDTTISNKMNPNSAITNVSWYAAKAYCECQGKRMATVDEWEYVGMANEKMADARKIKSYNQFILDWYEKPKTSTNPIGESFKNYWGVYDLHGLVWEWTTDFSSILLTGESRNDVKTDKDLFCGSGSLNATDLMNYAAFMRYAFRGSLKANYAVQNLGFRCVKDSMISNENDK
jgi:formylglycine-generating enzyme required for sulfatase activity